MHNLLESLFLPVVEAGMAVFAAVLFVILSVACEVGFRLGRWHGRKVTKSDAENDAVSTLTGGMLALLAFMLALTVSFAQSRFEARRDLVAVEANAIDTAWLRARLIGGSEGEAMAGLITDYAKTRLAFTRADLKGPVYALVARSDEEKKQIWIIATDLARRFPTPITATLVTALNPMFDASVSQQFAFEGRVPHGIMTMLLTGSVLAIGAMGFQLGMVGQRQTVLSSLLLAMWVGGMVMTMDLNRPRLGSLRVDASPLVWTIDEMTSAPAIP
jgi:hypothetical protein